MNRNSCAAGGSTVVVVVNVGGVAGVGGTVLEAAPEDETPGDAGAVAKAIHSQAHGQASSERCHVLLIALAHYYS